MTDVRTAVQAERLQQGVFLPSKAEIAKEMKCRLNLKQEEDERPSSSSPDRR